MNCPRCGEEIVVGQEYCLECGSRQPGLGRLGAPPVDRRRLGISVAIAGILAVAGAAVAIAATREAASAEAVVTATGGSPSVATPTTSQASRLVQWSSGKRGWTNVLISIPKVEGRDAAVARAEQARRRGLREVGVLDSSRYASLHPGYWIVFAGVYSSEAEATSRLRAAKAVQKTARTQRVTA
jgi:hypothetical protein